MDRVKKCSVPCKFVGRLRKTGVAVQHLCNLGSLSQRTRRKEIKPRSVFQQELTKLAMPFASGNEQRSDAIRNFGIDRATEFQQQLGLGHIANLSSGVHCGIRNGVTISPSRFFRLWIGSMFQQEFGKT